MKDLNHPLTVLSYIAWTLAVVGLVYIVWISHFLPAVAVVATIVTCHYIKRKYPAILDAKGKYILITGCDTGIGYETALSANRQGFSVIACCLKETSDGARKLRNASSNIQVVEMDVTSDSSVAECLDKVKDLCQEQGLWGLVNNAGFNFVAPVEITSMETFQQLSGVMLFGMIRVTKAFLPYIRKIKGRIVTMSSDRGMLSPANSSAYCIAKHGVETFSDVLRKELAQFGVKVCVIQPGNFGAATAIINDASVKLMQSMLDRDFNLVTTEVQKEYGSTLVDKILTATIESRKTSALSIMPVVNSILDALINVHPATRYPVHGSKGILDWRIIFGQIKPFLPDTVMDMAHWILDF